MSQDRPSGKRILVTVAVVVVLAAVLLLAAWAVIGWLAPKPTGVLRRDPAPARGLVATSSVGGSRSRVGSLAADAATPTTESPQPRALASPDTKADGTFVVAIDPGHGGKADSRQEPIGPGATQTRPREPGGASGVVTGIPESQLNLEVALKLRNALQRRGIKVVMIRTTQNVNISPSERAKVANDARADLLVRIHADSSGDGSLQGIKTLVPGQNPWTAPIYAESMRAGTIAQRHLIAETGAKDLGVVKRNDLGGFNWSKMPTYLVEMGFLSNPTEDRKMETGAYQARIVGALTDAVVEYLQQ